MSELDEWTAFQSLAWICWRSKRAVRMFSNDQAAERWLAALRGEFPPTLGKPKVTPAVAERELSRAIREGALPYRGKLVWKPRQ